MHFSDLSQYDYQLPPELIRKVPLEPRDSARLFVYDTVSDSVHFDTFRNVAAYLPAGSVIVLNNTRVWPARLWLRKPTGGKIEVLVLVNEWNREGLIPAVVDRKIHIGDALCFPDSSRLIAEKQEEQRFYFRLVSDRTLFELLEAVRSDPDPALPRGRWGAGRSSSSSALSDRVCDKGRFGGGPDCFAPLYR